MNNPLQNLKHWDLGDYPRVIVFMSSFCLMVVEIVAGRIMAPYLGVSLFTWTSIIGVVLAGISLGNYLGGKIADKQGSRQFLGLIFLLSAATTVVIIIFSEFLGWSLRSNFFFSLPISTLIFSFSLFFVPSLLLSFITPIVIKLELNNLDQTGTIVGKIYSASALGSILGTFATGYLFISLFGVRSIIFGISAILLLMAASLNMRFLKQHIAKILIVFLPLALYSYFAQGPCNVESDYYCISATSADSAENPEAIALHLDQLVHGYIIPGKPNFLGYKYERVYALLAEYLREEDLKNVLNLGGGAYVLPRYLETNFPETINEVVEIDPAVTKFNFDELALAKDTKIITHNIDARIFLQRQKRKPIYDAIFADVFNDLSVPYHLTTREFNEEVKARLNERGYYAVNIIDDYKIGSFLISYIQTLSLTFSHVYLAPTKENVYDIEHRNTYVVIAGEQALDIERWNATYDKVSAFSIYPDADNENLKEDILSLVYGADLDEFIARKNSLVLSDDYSPVDNMLAPVFLNK